MKRFAQARQMKNVVCLPYEPLDELSASLSAADLHVVVMGDPFVGIVHPCKIYNVLRIGAPFLAIGPETSHLTDLLSEGDVSEQGTAARHGEVELVVECLEEAAARNDWRHVRDGALQCGAILQGGAVAADDRPDHQRRGPDSADGWPESGRGNRRCRR